MAQISMRKLDAVVKSMKKKDVHTVAIGVGEDAVNIEVKYRIKFADAVELIRAVVDNVITEFGYMPEMKEVAMAGNIFAYYTNLKDDLGIERIAELIETGVYERVLDNISSDQYFTIIAAVDARIEHELKKSVAGTERQIERAADQIQHTADAFKLIEEELSQIGTDKFKAAVENLGAITPAQIVDVMMPANEH